MIPDPSLSTLLASLGLTAETPVLIERLEVLDWGQMLLFHCTAGDRTFTMRYRDCRELRWRIYVNDHADSTPLVSFSPGRDQQRSQAQFLTAHFGLSIYYGSVEIK